MAKYIRNRGPDPYATVVHTIKNTRCSSVLAVLGILSSVRIVTDFKGERYMRDFFQKKSMTFTEQSVVIIGMSRIPGIPTISFKKKLDSHQVVYTWRVYCIVSEFKSERNIYERIFSKKCMTFTQQSVVVIGMSSYCVNFEIIL